MGDESMPGILQELKENVLATIPEKNRATVATLLALQNGTGPPDGQNDHEDDVPADEQGAAVRSKMAGDRPG